MSRKPIFSTNKEIATVLKAFAAGQTVSYDHRRRLVATGHIVATKSETREMRRGPRTIVYALSGKGKGLLNLSKNWK